jgi:hypothetical protein
MPELTRRRYPEARDECWHVYFGDVHAGTLAIRTGNPHDTDSWEWRDQRDWTERKYALWDAGKRLESPSHGPGKPCSRFMKCPCGEIFAMYEAAEVVLHVPHVSAAETSRSSWQSAR